MDHDWGAVWVHRTYLKSPLRFRLTSLMDGQVVETPGPCLPAGWVAGKDYDCQVQFSGGGGGEGGGGGGGGVGGGGGGGSGGGWGSGGGGGNGGRGNSTGGSNGWSGGGESEGNSGILPPKNRKTPSPKSPPPKTATPPKKCGVTIAVAEVQLTEGMGHQQVEGLQRGVHYSIICLG
ncbi:unnamed protein product [Closterium sp. NIES-54]